MGNPVQGIVKDGVIVPEVALPEGARVEIRVLPAQLEMPPEWQAEFEAWNRASARALELVEGQTEEGDAREAR
jgi:hypothetical protein